MAKIFKSEGLSVIFIILSLIGLIFKSALPYNPVTAAFMHSSFDHWLNNCMLFAILSPFVERSYGKAVYLLGFAWTCLVNFLYMKMSGQYGIGLSAFVFALFMLATFANTKMLISICGIFVIITYGGQELWASKNADGIGHMHHFIGMLSGATFGLIVVFIKKKISKEETTMNDFNIEDQKDEMV